ncbi:lanthionine synthetase LanC family protein [Bacillus thuringiensis]|nr:lanthionine synthetase LanC family protein [Bacillus thuringiensis]MRB60542.1 protein kinase [Bacillus thuringiensis]
MKRRLDPEEILNNTFPLLRNLRASRILVPAHSEEARHIVPTLTIGTRVAKWEVLHCVQVLEDIEVYQVKEENGTLCALKIARKKSDEQANKALIREADIIERLDGIYNPKFRHKGLYQGKRYLVMEWCTGKIATIVAEELRKSSTSKKNVKLHDICCRILEAYASLHAQGIIHADVHPRNLLIDEVGRVKIIDFGLSWMDKQPQHFDHPQRAGIGFYFEPEYAKAYLIGKDPEPVTIMSEQYALGALLYLLLTGRYYLDFSFEKMEMFRQISEENPLPFTYRGMEPWPKVEESLARALSKNPEERFPSVAIFTQQLRAALDPIEINSTNHDLKNLSNPTILREERLKVMLQKYGTLGTLISKGLPYAPTSSINFGSAGIAYMFYRIACLRNDPTLLAVADLWSNRAKRESDWKSAFHSQELDFTEKTIGPISIYHTVSGVHCVQGLINSAMGDFSSLSEEIQHFVATSQHTCENMDLTLGRSSTLIGCTNLINSISSNGSVDKSILLELGQNIVEEIWSQIKLYAPIQECKELSWLGIAHGWAGILYATLQWCHVLDISPTDEVEKRLWQLADLAETKGKGVCWKRSLRDNTVWSGWCHGTAGYTHLWSLAYEVYGDFRLFELAERSAWHTWTEADGNSSNLCCGLAGQSYALLNIYKHTKDRKWLNRARKIGEMAISNMSSPWLRSNSLYWGDVGIALLIADLSNPEYACMPLFELECGPLREES